MRELLSAVVYCHGRGVIHRNIKPESLLLDSSDKNPALKVANFGMSAIVDPDLKALLKIEDPVYIAPEVLLKNYTEKCDVWSCGVLLYILLSGTSPFTGASREELCHNIQRGIYSISGPRWEAVSKSAKDLVKSMLTRDPARRCSALEALNHEWVRGSCRDELNSTETKHLLEKLKCFGTESKLQQMALSYIVSQLVTNKEKKPLQSLFLALDKNEDGRLDREELAQGYKKVFGAKYITEKEVDSIMQSVDITRDGYIDFTEFLMATINKKSILSVDRLIAAFNRFDVDGSGVITADTIESIYRNVLCTSSGNRNEAVKEEENERISFEKFVIIMSKLIESN